MNRREFINGEAAALLRFEWKPTGPFESSTVAPSWVSREYRCDCGFRCAAAGVIFDHAAECQQVAR